MNNRTAAGRRQVGDGRMACSEDGDAASHLVKHSRERRRPFGYH